MASVISGGRTDDEIISWLEKKTGPAVITLETSEAIKEFIDAIKSIGVIGYFEVSSTVQILDVLIHNLRFL